MTEEKTTQLPELSGYMMMCFKPEIVDKFEQGLLKPDSLQKIEEFSTVVLFVAKMGPDCFKDKTRFPNGPWCKEGDFILVRAYSGTRFKIHNREFRLINDDSVEAVVQDPRGITRA